MKSTSQTHEANDEYFGIVKSEDPRNPGETSSRCAVQVYAVPAVAQWWASVVGWASDEQVRKVAEGCHFGGEHVVKNEHWSSIS
jgi:hypothetical protein